MGTRTRKMSDVTGYAFSNNNEGRDRINSEGEIIRPSFYISDEETKLRKHSDTLRENLYRKRILSDPEYKISSYNTADVSFRKHSDTSDSGKHRFVSLMRKKSDFESDNLSEQISTISGCYTKARRRSSADNPMNSISWRYPRRSYDKVFQPEMIPENQQNIEIGSSVTGKSFSKTRSMQNFGTIVRRKSKAQLLGKSTKTSKFLRRVQSERFIQPVWKDRHLPLVRFRKAVRLIQLLLRATFTSRPPQRSDVKFLSWAHYQDEILSSKRSYEMVGLSFDPSNYRAKKENFLSNEAKNILTMNPSERTKEQLKVALLALNQTVEAFGEFPITMQKSLVRVGWYENYEDKRVIIRQGHMADNFYFILSGKAIVTKLETDHHTGEEVIRTVAVLKKGNSFGELALMHGAKRSATVICKEEVELLAVGREDFVDVFMPSDKKQEPEHIRFLRTVDVFSGWPVEKLPYHDSKVCCFTYFRRGLLLCKDSNTSEWVYIVKTGSCRVLKSLYCTKPNVRGLKPDCNSKYHIRLPPLESPNSTITSPSSSPSTDITLLQHTLHNEVKRKRRRNYTLGYLHNVLSKPVNEIESVSLEHKQAIENVYKTRTGIGPLNRYYKSSRIRDKDEIASTAMEEKIPKVYVQIQKLGPKDTYGIEEVAFGMIDQTTSVILVSDGAECILINKKFFRQHLTDRAAKDIRKTYQPLPSEEHLQQKLQDKTNWEAYKSLTVTKYMEGRHAMQESLFF